MIMRQNLECYNLLWNVNFVVAQQNGREKEITSKPKFAINTSMHIILVFGCGEK